jgi:hypothetical protein
MSEKIEAFWQYATAEDVAGIANTRKPIPARFRDENNEAWLYLSLAGWKLRRFSDVGWIDSDCTTWNHCQVYREPSWYTERPDPGPGWRLLEKFPLEAKLGTDHYWSILGAGWRLVGSGDNDQAEQVWYRRRIEPVEPEPKHYVLRFGDSCETPCGNRIVVTPQGSTQMFVNAKAGDTIKTIHGQTITITAKGFEVTQ